MEVADDAVKLLIERARLGAGSGLGELLQHFHTPMMEAADRGIQRRLQCRMSRSDLVQDTMLTASQRFNAFRGTSEAEMRDWLMGILKSRLIDGLRRHRVAQRRRQQAEVKISDSQIVDDAASPSQLVVLEEEAADLMMAIQRLAEPLRVTLAQRYVQDLTFVEIAEIQGVSIATVWRRWAEAVEILKRSLQPMA